MVRTIVKILYIAVAAVLAVLFGILNYNTGADEEYISAVSKADKAESSEDLIYAFSSFSLPYDSNPYATINKGVKTDKGLMQDDLSIYGSINQVNVGYYEKAEDTEATKKFARVEFVYYVLIRCPQFKIGTYQENGEMRNSTGIRFYSADESKYYDYHFVVSKTINKDDYNEKPLSNTEALMMNGRTYTTTYKNTKFNYDFMLVPFSETMISYISTKISGDIKGISVMDAENTSVYNDIIPVTLNFSQDFFVDLGQYRTSFQRYYDTEDEAVKKECKDYIDNFKLASFNKDNYKEGIKREEVYTGGLVWRTIGFVALFVVSFAIIYMLFFHFALIKRLVFRRSTANKNSRYVPNKIDKSKQYQPKNKATTFNAQVKDVTNETKVEEVKEDAPVETAPLAVQEELTDTVEEVKDETEVQTEDEKEA